MDLTHVLIYITCEVLIESAEIFLSCLKLESSLCTNKPPTYGKALRGYFLLRVLANNSSWKTIAHLTSGTSVYIVHCTDISLAE